MPITDAITLDLFTVGRGLVSASTLTLVGTCVFAALMPRWRQDSDDKSSFPAHVLARCWRLALAATLALLVGHLFRVYGQVVSFLDPEEYFSLEAARTIVIDTTWGRGWIAQVVAAGLCVPLAIFAGRRPTLGLALLSTGALAVVITAPLTGHAVEHPWGMAIGVGLHALHILGGSVWVGTLFSMVGCGLMLARKSDAKAVARMVRTFTPVALTGAATAVAAGLLLAITYVGSFEDLWESEYGLVLMIKVGFLAFAMVLGGWNWKSVGPELGTHPATLTLRWSASLELCFAALLLAATAVLVALPAPGI
ncbi:MAG: CopD family protein [Gemmatimonadales bacterium]